MPAFALDPPLSARARIPPVKGDSWEHRMSKAVQLAAFGSNAAAYDSHGDGRQRTMAKKARYVAAMIAPDREACSPSILEVGCGTGLLTARLAELLPQAMITATDALPAMIEQARLRLARFANVRLAQYDAEEELPTGQRFDVVCGCDIIHHIDDPVRGMRHWLKAMNPGGRLAFFETNGINPVLYLHSCSKPEEARLILSRPRNLRRWLGEAGWQEIRVDYAAIHLPNGPPPAWRLLDRIEDLMHKVPPLRLLAGGLLIEAHSA